MSNPIFHIEVRPLIKVAEEDIFLAESENLVPYTGKPFFEKFKEKTEALAALKHSPKKDPVGERKILGQISPHKRKLEDERLNLQTECQKIYNKAVSSKMPFVLGSEELRGSEGVIEMKNFGVLCTDIPACPKAVIASGVDVQTGAILCDSSWSVIKNDWAMLGVIHAARTCYVSKIHDKDLEKDLWDEESLRPKVLGREIVMLHFAGYRQVADPADSEKYGHTFVALDKDKARQMSYNEMISSLKAIRSKDDILDLLTTHIT